MRNGKRTKCKFTVPYVCKTETTQMHIERLLKINSYIYIYICRRRVIACIYSRGRISYLMKTFLGVDYKVENINGRDGIPRIPLPIRSPISIHIYSI